MPDLTRRGFIGGLLAGVAAVQLRRAPWAPVPTVGDWWDVVLTRAGTCTVNGIDVPYEYINEWVAFDPPRLYIGDGSMAPSMPDPNFMHDAMAVRLRIVSETEMHVEYMHLAGPRLIG